jgi:hypothetical protein
MQDNTDTHINLKKQINGIHYYKNLTKVSDKLSRLHHCFIKFLIFLKKKFKFFFEIILKYKY